MEILYVVLMGLGVVFTGLICIIIICSIMSRICRIFEKKSDKEPSAVSNSFESNDKIENRGELVAAISAAIAEEEGKDISSIRILSLKKI